ncbi:amino acid ABC transporter permease [Vibrio gazogenes]|uniref:General L-amino acid transport system permease protein n=1 Tax=Vibrio gazogenes DSM 21264 = NBRC 103151 TaxID=1123492 RepID=A0A1M4XWR4_VIBGA|nr:amino acid ABC transporter permease [Vibrio gazogenes]USP12851.1 amino acid ABC transporter permease [Vibrio gazogenes]SHE98007.1 general L-amino acid transport system permease protein [Vibrio gazogenes DSM 21264] [Vibrio gazogenes DSM 21264 = NBRC 103151]
MQSKTTMAYIEPRPAIEMKAGWKAWCHQNLFSSVFNTCLTVIGLLFVVWLVPTLLNWFIFDATFVGTSQADCVSGGACWLPVVNRIELFTYGMYPEAQQWRVDVAFGLAAIAIPMLYIKRFNKLVMLCYIAVLPFAMWMLLKGGMFGLETISTTKFAGMMLTLFLAIFGMVFALPLGILLALGRRSKRPVIHWLSVAYIELVRSVPVITLLFMASLMIQLFLPPGQQFDVLLRVVAVLVLFTAAYMAETIRGGLQSIPQGQFEAAQALGFSYWRMMGQIILPQVLKNSIPSLLNQFVGILKETTLVMIVGVLDIVGVASSTLSNAKWVGLENEMYAFLAVFFFICCFSLSQYATHLERRLK